MADHHMGRRLRGIPARRGHDSAAPTLDGQQIEIVAKQPYAAAVHEGSKAHDIPNAFGWGPTFGIGGRFGGFFHPGIVPEHAQPFLRQNLPLFFAA